MDELKIGIIGLGERGYFTLSGVLRDMEGLRITHLCDVYEDRVEKAQKFLQETKGYTPKGSADYRRLIEDPDVDVVIIASAWENHLPATLYAMRAGKYVGCEVGGAYSVDDCWQLIRAYEETGRHVMMLENCCYGRDELMALNMVKQGLFGKIVACEGGYRHDLRHEILYGEENRHYRLRNYLHRNCENYPTHELGPIAKVLNINRGNRMVTLNAVASGAWGLNEYAAGQENADPAQRIPPLRLQELRTARFAQGDMVKTCIKCAGGELITLTLDTTLPRHYSRGFAVHGTKGNMNEPTRSVFLDSLGEAGNKYFDNIADYRAEWEHPIWKRYIAEGVKEGHDGIDWLVFSAFFDAIRTGEQFPIDTYDMAAWMAVTPLSEISIAQGGAPVDVPDFTRGAWTGRTDGNHSRYTLDYIQ